MNIKETKAKYFEERQHQNKKQKVSDSMSPWYIEPLPDFFAPPGNQSRVPIICELDQLLCEILQILKKMCVL